jgi:hypothetical protein
MGVQGRGRRVLETRGERHVMGNTATTCRVTHGVTCNVGADCLGSRGGVLSNKVFFETALFQIVKPEDRAI